MKDLLSKVAVLLLVVVPALAQRAVETETIQKLRAELIEIESAIELTRRLVPPDFELADERTAIDALAQKAELSAVELQIAGEPERLRLEDGRPAPLQITAAELTGNGTYSAVHFFLSMLQYRPRLIDVASLRLDAAGAGRVRFTARLRFPTWAPAPPERSTSPDPLAAVRERVSAARSVRDTIVAELARMRDRGKLDALALFTEAAEKHSIALTAVRIDDAISIEGLLAGEGARAGFAAALTAAALRPVQLEWSPAGVCRAFSLRARPELPAEPSGLPDAGSSAFTAGRDIFDRESAAFCRGEQPAPTQRIVAGKAGSAKEGFLRLRDVDLVDVFFVLSDLLGENFVVDHDVKGRVSLDVHEDATIDGTMDALSAAGIVISSPPLRHVRRKETSGAPPAELAPSGPPINVSLRNASLSTVLCILGNVLERKVEMDRDFERRVSVFATELPAGIALAALRPKPEKSPAQAAVNACEVPSGSGSRLGGHLLTLEQLGLADMRVAGLARIGDVWRAYVPLPGRGLIPIEVGQRLFDGRVKSIGPKGVIFLSGQSVTTELQLVP